jgi:hypothetical protein
VTHLARDVQRYALLKPKSVAPLMAEAMFAKFWQLFGANFKSNVPIAVAYLLNPNGFTPSKPDSFPPFEWMRDYVYIPWTDAIEELSKHKVEQATIAAAGQMVTAAPTQAFASVRRSRVLRVPGSDARPSPVAPTLLDEWKRYRAMKDISGTSADAVARRDMLAEYAWRTAEFWRLKAPELGLKLLSKIALKLASRACTSVVTECYISVMKAHYGDRSQRMSVRTLAAKTLISWNQQDIFEQEFPGLGLKSRRTLRNEAEARAAHRRAAQAARGLSVLR